MSRSIVTATGRWFEFDAPEHSVFGIEDIASALSKLCRFTGHCKSFYCPAPEERILTADLEWVPAGDLSQGAEILAFDENPVEIGSAGVRRRRFRHGMVTHAEPVRRQVVRLELSDGSCVRSSAEHPWLVATKQSRNQSWLSAGRIARDLRAGRRRYMHRFVEPWSAEASRESGWLAGMYDGEGCLSARNRGGTQLGISQNPGLVLDELQRLLVGRGFSFSGANTGAGKTVSLQVRGGWREAIRLLGTVRPLRLLDTFRHLLRDGHFDKQLDGQGEPPEIVAAYDEGEGWVAGLSTTTSTYICSGFGAHNSVAQHSVLVSREVPEKYALEGLLHDASEAFLGDVSSPLKALLPDYRKMESRINAVVRRRFGLRDNVSNSVKHADLVLLATEARDLLPLGGEADSWSLLRDIEPLPYAIEPLSPEQARREFLNRYEELTSNDEGRLLIDGEELRVGSMAFSWSGTFTPSAELREAMERAGVPEEEAPSILSEAESLVSGDRQRDYAPPRENLGRIATLWSVLLDHEVTPEDVARCMIAVKLARDCATAKRDNAVDIAGYAQVLDMVREARDE